MEQELFVKELFENFEQEILNIENNKPILKIRARLIDQITNRAIFAVINTNTKVNWDDIIEAKAMLVPAGKEYKTDGGANNNYRIADFYDSKIVVLISRKVAKDDYYIIIDENANNKILLKAAKRFIASGKKIPEALYKNNYTIENCQKQDKNQQKPVSFPRISRYNLNLNEFQNRAVEYASLNVPFKILGPPGTGKTETIVEIISVMLARGESVLVCGPSNISIDNIISRFVTSGYYLQNRTPFYRLGSSVKGLVHHNLDEMAQNTVDFLSEELNSLKRTKNKADNHSKKYKEASRELSAIKADKAERISGAISEIKARSKLVFATLFSSLKENHYFDQCVVDEACQASEMELFMALVKAKNFILAGDPFQLSAERNTTQKKLKKIESKESQYYAYINTNSLYEKLDLPTLTLNIQYRMHASLIAFSNSYFYQSFIQSPKHDEFSFFGKERVLYIDTSYCELREDAQNNSRINRGEAEIIGKVTKYLLSKYPKKSIGIIAPYSAQCILIRDTVTPHELLSVNTVDGFQGQERDFILFSMVRSNEDFEYGFLDNKKRMNVALTRAKTGIVIVGDSQNFRRNKFFSTLLAHLEENAFVVDPETFDMLSND
ncbi:hypothetical protein ENBRE01_0783 [Enteropsectra breve]|nr:hypothetical protein ENBRE01_0783 [Enteropsectra breve]